MRGTKCFVLKADQVDFLERCSLMNVAKTQAVFVGFNIERHVGTTSYLKEGQSEFMEKRCFSDEAQKHSELFDFTNDGTRRVWNEDRALFERGQFDEAIGQWLHDCCAKTTGWRKVCDRRNLNRRRSGCVYLQENDRQHIYFHNYIFTSPHLHTFFLLPEDEGRRQSAVKIVAIRTFSVPTRSPANWPSCSTSCEAGASPSAPRAPWQLKHCGCHSPGHGTSQYGTPPETPSLLDTSAHQVGLSSCLDRGQLRNKVLRLLRPLAPDFDAQHDQVGSTTSLKGKGQRCSPSVSTPRSKLHGVRK